MELSALKSTTLADSVEKQLLTYIKQSRMVSGDIFPKEEELALQMNVSRHIVREGMSRLKALGIIDARKKGGTVLCRLNAFEGMRKLVQAELFSGDEMRQLMELRVALELGMCDFIYLRKTPEKLALLRSKCGRRGSYVHSLNVEVNFHLCLMQCSGNEIATQFREILMNAFKNIYHSGGDNVDRNQKTPTHYDICDALENGTVEEFRDVVRRHFEVYFV